MKKIFLTLIVVALAASSYAANVQWEFVSMPNYTPYASKSYFIFDGDISSYVATLTESNYAGFTSSLPTDRFYSNGTLNEIGSWFGTIPDVGDEIGLVIFDDTADGSTFYYGALDTAGYTFEEGQGVSNTLTFLATNLSTGKIGSAVPEPTVLALLALGVAGVALRRKKVVA